MNLLKKFLKNFLPDLYLYFRSVRVGRFEYEVPLVKYLCNKNKISLDVGAADGAYTYLMLKYSRHVMSFDPLQRVEDHLENLFRNRSNFQFLRIGLSDRKGTKEIRIPSDDWGRSTIEDENNLEDISGSVSSSIIQVDTIDNMQIDNIGFIKIDVEGHEISVLKGSQKSIEKFSPNFLIEIEERHKPGAINTILSFLSKFDYLGFYFVENKLIKMNLVKKNLKNDFSGKRINNFIFLSSHNLSSADIIKRFS